LIKLLKGSMWSRCWSFNRNHVCDSSATKIVYVKLLPPETELQSIL